MAQNKKQMTNPLRVLITGASGQIGYSLIPLVASGQMLGFNQPVILHLLDLPQAAEMLKGVVMEINDCAYPLVHDIVSTTDQAEGFKDVDVALLLGGFPRLNGMTRADLLLKNKDIFFAQGASLCSASPDCKVLVVANPANTNCILAYDAMVEKGGKIPAANFSCLMRLDHNRAASCVSKKLNVNVGQIKNIAVWGNHSMTQFPDCHNATVSVAGSDESTPVTSALGEEAQEWYEKTFQPTIQTRGAAVIKQRGKSSALSAANAVKDHIRDWVQGTPEGEWVSMGVVSDGTSYGVPEGIVFSFPVTCKEGKWTIVQDLELSAACKTAITDNVEKLQGEKATALGK